MPFKNAFDWLVSGLEAYFLMWATFFIIGSVAIFHHKIYIIATTIPTHRNEVVVIFAYFFERELDLGFCNGNVGVR